MVRAIGPQADLAAAEPASVAAMQTEIAAVRTRAVLVLARGHAARAEWAGRRRFVPITGGTVTGRIAGRVLAGGGDWQTIGDDGVTAIHARYAFETPDGVAIGIDNPGVRVATPEVLARLTAGEDVDPSLYYFRTTPVFDVRPGAYGWLRRSIFVGVGIRHPATVELKVFRVDRMSSMRKALFAAPLLLIAAAPAISPAIRAAVADPGRPATDTERRGRVAAAIGRAVDGEFIGRGV